MDEWGCPTCKKCHCQCHLFCDYHYDPTDEWNRDQCHTDGFDQVGLLRGWHLLWETQDTLQPVNLAGSTMIRDGQLRFEMAWRQGQLQASAFSLQGCQPTGLLFAL